MFLMRYLFFTCLLLTMFFYGFAGDAAEFHVAPGGDDAAAGTADAPFASIARAREAVRDVLADMDADVAVVLHGGTYRLAKPLKLTPEDSGMNGHAVIYRAAAGETPVLSGGREIRKWREGENGMWVAPAKFKDCRQLYVNGVRTQRARGPFPEGAERFGDLQFIDSDAGFVVPAAYLAEWKHPEEMELGFYNSWSHMIARVDRIEADGSERARVFMQQPCFTLVSRREGVRAETPAYIENAGELLDEPGEWYFDREAKELRYMPREGEARESAEAVVPVLETLLIVAGTPDAPVHDVRFEGITFAEATWLGPNRHGLADVQANCCITPDNVFERDGNLVNLHNEYRKSPANVRLRGAHRVQFERCVFTRLGGAGLDIESGSRENVVNGCIFRDISGSGIQIGDVQRRDHHPEDEREIVKGNRVTNNLICRIGAEYQDSVGVFGGYTQETVIAHNEITDLPYSGISLGWGWGEEDSGGGSYPVPYVYEKPTPARDNRVEQNHIHGVMRDRNDGGGIYTLGNQPGSVIAGNHIHDNGAGGGPAGIYLDEGSGFIEVTANCVYAVPTPFFCNNRAQDRIDTINEHDNWFDIAPDAPDFPKKEITEAGLEAAYRNLLE